MKMSFLNMRTRSLLRKNHTARVSTPFRKAESFGVLFSADDKLKHEAIKEFIRNLEHEGKKVSVISFLPRKKENFEFLFDYFTEQDVSFWGKLLSTDALRFSDTAFDYLYCLDTVPNPFTLHMLARSKAKCRIGKFWQEREPYFEMMIGNVAHTKGLIDEALKYTRGLR